MLLAEMRDWSFGKVTSMEVGDLNRERERVRLMIIIAQT